MPITKIIPQKELADKLFLNNWKKRRTWLSIGMLTLSINAELVLINILFYGGGNYATQVFMTLISLIGSIFMFYVFGAVWDDTDKRRHFNWSKKDDEDGDDGDDEDDDSEDDKSTDKSDKSGKTNDAGDDLILPTPKKSDKE